MDVFQKMRQELTGQFERLDEESLILVMGGASQQLSATGSCGSTGSSNKCVSTAVCNCCQPTPIKKPGKKDSSLVPED